MRTAGDRSFGAQVELPMDAADAMPVHERAILEDTVPGEFNLCSTICLQVV